MPSRKDLPIPFRVLSEGNHASIGSWITIPHPSIAEIMARAGFDWLVVDMEHSPIEISDAEGIIRVIQLSGLPALVRVSENNPNLIKRAMDCGASGVIVPMVNSEEEAKQAVATVKYPPVGHRGVGLARAQGYGTLFPEYKEWVLNESTVIVQIEHVKAVKNIDAILSVEGIDGFIVGPYDLSGSLGVPGEFDQPAMLDALEVIRNVITSGLKPGGFHVVQPDPDIALSKLQEGYSFLAFGVDFLFLGEMCRGRLKSLKDRIP